VSKKIYLSPSNQDGNLYAYGGTNEMEQCNRIAEYAKIALERCGFSVKKAPKGQKMRTSIEESNKWGADLHIPIHTNAFNGKASGTVVFVYDTDSAVMKLATPIYKYVQSVAIGTTDYGIRQGRELAEINSTTALAVYIEVDFHDNKEIAKWLIEHTDLVGEAICMGVCEGYGVEYIPEKTHNIYKVQVGAFIDKKKADTLLAKLKQQGYNDAFITVKRS
jgi:N-acetylmuramoyl-L-alanine amidase